jgi:DNA-binding MarR family transcriptional regulator
VVARITPVGIPTTKTTREATPLLQLLNQVHHQIEERASAAVGGTARLEEWAVLSALSDGDGHSMGDIAGITHTPSPSMTKLVNRLVAADLMYRRIDPVDRRRVLVFLSARGRARYRRLRSLVDASIADLSDDQQLRDLVGELDRRIGPNPKLGSGAQRGARPAVAIGAPSKLD